MPVPRESYEGVISFFLGVTEYHRAYEAVRDDFEVVINTLQGEDLRKALKHLYLKWAIFDDDGELLGPFIAQIMTAVDASLVPEKATRPHTQFDITVSVGQGVLF